jgi:hypothetical protein
MSSRYRLQYTKSHEHSGDTLLDIDMTFENADYIQLRDNLNTWLNAIGMNLRVVHIENKETMVAQAVSEKIYNYKEVRQGQS